MDGSVKWAIDLFFCYIGEFKKLFGYPPVIPKIRGNYKSICDLITCIDRCINNKDDTDYIDLVCSDYESRFKTKVKLNEGYDKKRIAYLIESSFEYDVDLIYLYNQGVSDEEINSVINKKRFEV